MAELLLRWINDDLQLSKHVTDVQVDFASGYLLGELLHRLNQQHNFSDFMRSSSADAKIINFCLLEPSLRNLNIKFDANVATAIMNEKKDAAANLLNQIKIAATRVGRAPSVSTRSLERKSIFPLHNRPVKLAKPIYDSENHRQFEHSIRRHVQSGSAIDQDNDRIAEERNKRKAYLDKMAQQKQLLEDTKAERLHRAFIHSSYIKEALDETDSPAWRLALQKKNARERRRAAFFQQMVTKREEAEEHLTFSLRHQMQRDLDDFDARSGSKCNISGGKVPYRKSAGYGLRSLTTSLNSSSDKKKYSTLNLVGSASNEWELYQFNTMEMESTVDTIKQQRHQREKRKGNLSRRRKRFVQECVYAHSRIEVARVASILEDVVLRDTNSEKDVQGEMSRILMYKEVARENRSMRGQAYASQQELDTLTAINRDTSCYHNLILRFEDDNEMQIKQRRNVQDSIESADHHLSKQISREIMSDLVKFVLFIAARREDTMHSRDPAIFLTPQTWNEYKVQFANGKVLGSLSSMPVAIDPSSNELLNSHELDQYLANFQPFRAIPERQSPSDITSNSFLFLGTMVAIEDCYVLGEGIKSLRWIARAELLQGDTVQQESVSRLQMSASSFSTSSPRRHLRILIFGPPFAGKKTQAKLLSEKHNLVVRSVQELIQDAILKSNDFGTQLEMLLSDGKEFPPEYYSQLVIDFIEENEAQPESNAVAGWIIYDLPSTQQHNQSLEEKLTGYVDPASTPSPYDLESAIAPGYSKPPLPPTFLHGKSGVDLVFNLDCPMNTVLDRCLGSVEDSSTGEAYHLVFSPPPEDSTTRHRLHHENPNTGASELLSLHCLANDDFSRGHKAWYTKFWTLYEQPSSGLTVNEVHEAMSAIVGAFQKQRQDEAASKESQQGENEQKLMAQEEERHRRITDFEAAIDEAKLMVAKIEGSIAEAEEAKAKKEEMLELRRTLEEAHKGLEGVFVSVKNWQDEELLLRPTATSKYSGDLVPSTASVLATTWDDMEVEYISRMKTSFEQLRKQRLQVTEHAQITTHDFCEFVRRPDQKQNIVDHFQKQFNEVIDEMRFDDLTKIELHARVDVLQDELVDLIAAKVSESEEELSGVIGDGWMEDMCQQVAATYQMALQAECDRFRVSIQLLVDGYCTASTDRVQLSSMLESWQALQPHLDLVCKIYHDPSNEIPPETPPAPAATGKAAPKGKGKPSTPAQVPAASAAITEESLAESLTMNSLFAEYGRILQRCDFLLETLAPVAAADGSGAEGGEHQQTEDSVSIGSIGDLGKVNLQNGIRYEHNLMQRRVRFLQEAAKQSCDEIIQSVRSIELTLREVLEDRRNREQVAVVALIEYIRSAVEAEVALPSVIDVSPEPMQRFPATAQLREDTLIRVNTGRRLLPRIPPDAPPIIEESHPLLLSKQQCDDLRDVLLYQSADNSGLLPMCLLIETMAALTSLPDALPDIWRRCPAHVIAEIAASFTTKQGAFVDVEALLNAMSTREDLLHQFQKDETKEQLERQRRFEQQQRQQEELERQQHHQEEETSEAEPTNIQ